MILATPETMRSTFGTEEIAALTRLYMEALPPDDEEHSLENGVLSWGLERASSRAVSHLAVRYPVLAGPTLPEGVFIPPALANAVCDIARYYLTGTAVQETDPIVKRYEDALAWFREIAAGEADLPGLDGGGGGDGEDELVTGDVAFLSNAREWSFSA